jgi:hypothetical protein
MAHKMTIDQYFSLNSIEIQASINELLFKDTSVFSDTLFRNDIFYVITEQTRS